MTELRAPFRIDTPRLFIRGWETTDVGAFRRLATDSRVMRYIAAGEPWPEHRIRRFFVKQENNLRRDGFCLGALCDRSNGRVVGLAGLQALGTSGEVEIGWWVEPDRWGEGLATEAGKSSAAFAFNEAKLARVVAITHPENRASRRVMEKVGMTFERRALGRELGLDDPDVEIVLYALEAPAS